MTVNENDADLLANNKQINNNETAPLSNEKAQKTNDPNSSFNDQDEHADFLAKDYEEVQKQTTSIEENNQTSQLEQNSSILTEQTLQPLTAISTKTSVDKSLEIEMFSYVSEFIAFKNELKQQNRTQLKTNEQMNRVLTEIHSFKADYEENLKNLEIELQLKVREQILYFFQSLLPALDGFDYALKHALESWNNLKNQTPSFFWNKKSHLLELKQAEAHYIGLKAIRARFATWMKQHGIDPIDIKDKTFDPKIMMAVDNQLNENLPNQTVIEEVKRGYRIQEQIIRPAEVIISLNKSAIE